MFWRSLQLLYIRITQKKGKKKEYNNQMGVEVDITMKDKKQLFLQTRQSWKRKK